MKNEAWQYIEKKIPEEKAEWRSLLLLANHQASSLATAASKLPRRRYQRAATADVIRTTCLGRGLVLAYRCAYHVDQQEDGAEQWQWYDDLYEEQPGGFDVGEYQPGLEVRNWGVGDSNEKTRKEFDRRRAIAVAKEACAEEAKWSCPRMFTSERSILPAYVLLITLIACMLIAVGVVSILPSIEEGVSTESVTMMPLPTESKARLADLIITNTADNSSYVTDVY
ncbi:hypothetical protein MRX96_051491 [Rhipicephalus microplus]